MSIVRCSRFHAIATVLFVLDRFRDTVCMELISDQRVWFDILRTPSACSQICRRCSTPAGYLLVTGLMKLFHLKKQMKSVVQ